MGMDEAHQYSEAGYTFVNCKKYDTEESQPHKVNLSFQALFLMNVHAHLFRHEIIGYNCGYFYEVGNSQHMFIHDSNVCRPLENIKADRTKTVEMDPESARMASDRATKKGQHILGWYHSHPQFDVNPSNIDVNNHRGYQQQWNNEQKPFVALIIGTFANIIDTKGLFTSLFK